ISDILDERCGARDVGDGLTSWDWLTDPPHQVREFLAVLSRGDRLDLRPEKGDAVTAQHARLPEFAAQVQSGLPAHPAEDALRLLLPNHLLQERDREGFHVDRARHPLIRLDRRRVA